nr:exosome component 10 isoform X2 [Ciona intestinalis]|eukprot:XP_018666785.1 exosome component 10 isoform X2 [Ciona intestinalis]
MSVPAVKNEKNGKLGKNIKKPQLMFKDAVDNTHARFIPKISNKPNALKPLPKELVLLNSQDNISKNESNSLAISNLIHSEAVYDHPYQYELENFKPLSSQLEKPTPIKSGPVDTDSCIFVDGVNGLNMLIRELKQESEIAVDLEAHSFRSYQGITCLMQLSTRKTDYIVDTLALRANLNILNQVFTNPKIVKVFHGADQDIKWLQRDFGVYVVNLFDTGQAARELKLGCSLEYLLKHYCKVESDKKFQKADWRERPLSKDMLKYAQKDTHYLLYIYDMMKLDLLEKAGDAKLMRKVIGNSRDICLLKYEKLIIDDTSHRKLLRKGAGKIEDWEPQELEALRLIYMWRDKLARQMDESCGYVLPNKLLVQIAKTMPQTEQDLRLQGVRQQYVQTIHQLIVEAGNKVFKSEPSSEPLHDSSNLGTTNDSKDPSTNKNFEIYLIIPILVAFAIYFFF